jgi:AAA15 family ATPase/GTPase
MVFPNFRKMKIILFSCSICYSIILYANESPQKLDALQEQARVMELEIEKIKQDLNQEAEDFKRWLEEEKSVFYLWNEQGTQHISATPPPWYRNPYYPSDLIHSCVMVYKNIQLIDNSCIKSDKIDEQAILSRHQKKEQYYKLKTELEVKEQELKTLAKMLKVRLNMSQSLVEMIWGKYDEGITMGDDLGETWYYKDGRWVTFREGKVDKFQDIR